MHNLLRTPLTASEILPILAAHRDVRLLPPRGAAEWTATFAKPAVQRWMTELRAIAERERDQPLPVLTDELYAEFHRSGNRRKFEDPYFERRRRLARAAICVLADGDRWWPSLLAKLDEVFGEVSWSLPAHVRDVSGKDPLMLDLFASETANLMGELLTLFGGQLPIELVKRVKARLHTDVFCNLRDRTYSWQTGTMNWNAVCHQGILGAALAVEDDQELVAQLLAQAGQNLARFLDGFTADGGCNEGPAYWVYGFGWFCELNRQLEARTGGALSLVEGDAHVREIVKYGPRVTLANDHVVNFSDCPARMSIRPDLLVYLGERFGDEAARDLGHENYRQLAEKGVGLQGQRCDLFYLARLFLRCPETLERASRLNPRTQPVPASTSDVVAGPPLRRRRAGSDSPPPESKTLSLSNGGTGVGAVAASDDFLPELGVLVVRSRDAAGHLWEFAAKAGHNAEHHNHNDCGSYLLHLDGEPQVCEIGSPEYVKDFFGPHRYEFLAARSQGHSLPVINGCEQAAGREYAAKILEQGLSDRRVRFVVDLTACYPAAAGCARCVRTFEFDKGAGRLTVADAFDLTATRSLETALITRADVAIESGVIRLGRLVVQPDPRIQAAVETHTYRDHAGQAVIIWRVVLRPTVLVPAVRLRYALGSRSTSASALRLIVG